MKNSVIQFETPVATLEQDGISYDLLLPQADRDHIQHLIRATGRPYEFTMLQDMRLRLRPDELVLDIGANIGNHALYLAAVARARVIAFEPNPELCASLAESAARNGLADRIAAHPLAVGLGEAAAHFGADRPENLGSQALVLGSGEIRVVALDTLDIEGPVRAIKIDVEGMELPVLQGGAALIARDRPLLYVESHDEAAFRQIAVWTQAAGYIYWETFNATPTHLFLPAETIGLEQRLERLNLRAVIQDYRQTDQSRRNRKARSDAQAEIGRLREEVGQLKERHAAAVAEAQAQVAALQADIAARDRAAAALKAEAARQAALARSERLAVDRQARQLEAVQQDLARSRAQLAKLWRYGQGLEVKHAAVLDSETWRAMEPVRWLLRTLKGRPAPASFVRRLTGPAPAPPVPERAAPEPALIGFDADLPRSDKVIAFLATYPAREGNLPQIVAALLPQCDVLNVYLNEYDRVPDCLAHDKIQAILGTDAAGDLKDNGKFYAPKYYPDGFHIFVDDDLIYPPDYTRRIVEGIRRFGYQAAVGFHGTIYEPPLASYIKDRTVLPFYAATRTTFVDQLGTGTVGFHTSTMTLDVAEFETAGAADLWFAKSAAERGVPLVALARPANWLRPMKEIDDTLFRRAQRDDARQTELLRERLAPVLRPAPRTRALDFLRSVYAPAYLDARIDLARSAAGAFGSATQAKSDIHFALIVTGWNCAAFVEPCLASIARQIPGGYTLDILIYDDGSTDETMAKLQARADVLNLKLFLGEANMGPAFARDFLIRPITDGQDICVLLDMDDQLLPHALAELERIYRRNPDCWMTYGNWINQNGQINDEGSYSDAEIDGRTYRHADVFRFTHLRSFRRFLYDKVEDVHLKDANGDWLRYCSDVGLMLPIADQCSSRNVIALEKPMYLYNQYRPTGTQRRFGSQKSEIFRYLRDNRDLFRYVGPAGAGGAEPLPSAPRTGTE